MGFQFLIGSLEAAMCDTFNLGFDEFQFLIGSLEAACSIKPLPEVNVSIPHR
ncbi:protein of unknown function [Mesotoga infera]|uniref:Uncharacterized protein n=1 Tax=Mesotoga infera TaxID=1236046 RepID=A0A7Z7LG19_9BACT|nr:protein of unknown function [Mesotoga infera]